MQTLERKNSDLKRWIWGLSAAAAAFLTLGAALPGRTDENAGKFDTVQANRVVITDSDGRERMVLELASGEPALSMFNHRQQRQVFLGIDENWQDTAFLSVSCRQRNGAVDKQAVLAATTAHPQSPGNVQLVLYDAKPLEQYSPLRHLLRLSSGRGDRKPYLELHESDDGGEREVYLSLLQAERANDGVLLHTDSVPAQLSGVELASP